MFLSGCWSDECWVQFWIGFANMYCKTKCSLSLSYSLTSLVCYQDPRIQVASWPYYVTMSQSQCQDYTLKDWKLWEGGKAGLIDEPGPSMSRRKILTTKTKSSITIELIALVANDDAVLTPAIFVMTSVFHPVRIISGDVLVDVIRVAKFSEWIFLNWAAGQLAFDFSRRCCARRSKRSSCGHLPAWIGRSYCCCIRLWSRARTWRRLWPAASCRFLAFLHFGITLWAAKVWKKSPFRHCKRWARLPRT